MFDFLRYRIDWSLIFLLMLVAIVVIVGINAAFNIDAVCNSRNNVSLTCINYRVDRCINSELYSRDECISFEGGSR